MILKTVTLLGVALCVLADGHHATSEQKVEMHFSPEHQGHHGDLAHIGDHKPEHHEEYAWSYPSYEFSYKVDDPHTHDKKGQQEHRHGDEVKGEYWLEQPDGRRRIVKYHTDKHGGFKADVHYEDTHYFIQPNKIEHHIPHVPHVEHIVKHHEPSTKHHIPIVELPEPIIEHKPTVEEHQPIEYHQEIHHPHITHKPIIIEHKPIHHEKYEKEVYLGGESFAPHKVQDSGVDKESHASFIPMLHIREPYYGPRRGRNYMQQRRSHY